MQKRKEEEAAAAAAAEAAATAEGASSLLTSSSAARNNNGKQKKGGRKRPLTQEECLEELRKCVAKVEIRDIRQSTLDAIAKVKTTFHFFNLISPCPISSSSLRRRLRGRSSLWC